MKKCILVMALIMSVQLILAGCTSKKAVETSGDKSASYGKMDNIMDRGPEKGGTLKLFSTEPDTLNPILSKNIYVNDFSNLIFEGLVTLDSKLKPVPSLAESWEASADGLSWTFYIRKNVFWHDNIPFSSDDVEFTMESILKGNVSTIYKKNLQNIATFAAIDKNTFRIILKKPNSFTPEQMVFPILPKHCYAGEDFVNSPRNMQPVGTGPYKFISYAKKSGIKLMIYDKWWNGEQKEKANPKPPYISEVDIKILDNNNEALNAFQIKDIDVAFVESGQCGKYSGRTDLVIKKYPGKNFDFIALNLNKPALSDKIVRQAVNLSVDRIRLVNEVYPGEAIPANIPLHPEYWLVNKGPVSTSSNSVKAKELLSQNGWRMNNETMYKIMNGVYTPLNFEILVNDGNELRLKAAEKIILFLREAGINVKVKKVTFDEMMRLVSSKSYDMAIMGYNSYSFEDFSRLYLSEYDSVKTGTNGYLEAYNVAGYKNPEVDGIINRIMTEINPENRKKSFADLQDIINTEVPYIGLYYNNHAVIYSKRIKGDINPNIWNRYNDFPRWYIPVK